MPNVKPIPEGYHSVTPYLYERNAAAAIEFYKKVFGAEEVLRMPGPGGKIMHAEINIGNSRVMLADENPQMNALGPLSVGGCGSSLYVYIEDVDAVVKRAEAAGATLTRPVKDQFYGDRSGAFTDPFGYNWYVATRVEDVTPEEIGRRATAAMSQSAGS
ncbi:MAG TPA: VOC family protein [Candidatus Sulfotelmatobacter sp.]|jgi:PhnB protein|nr:VOC family protein [Candidatus Sulfotelmatobacter sp.]